MCTANAGLFGPSDVSECIGEYGPKVRLADAKTVLFAACALGYEKNIDNPAIQKASKCIAKRGSDMYSFESTLKVINSCTKSDHGLFVYYQNRLLSEVKDAAEESARIQRFNQRRNENAIRDAQNGSVSIFDSATGEYKNCIKTGNQLNCF